MRYKKLAFVVLFILLASFVSSLSFIDYGQDGYAYVSSDTNYSLYLKDNSNWGDGFKFCIGVSCLIYQPQDMSYRNQIGQQEYLSNNIGVNANNDGSELSYHGLFPNVSVKYQILEKNVKEIYVLNATPRQPAEYLGNNVSLDFGGYIKFPGLSMESENEISDINNFITNSRITFKYGEENIYYLPSPYMYDSLGNYESLSYEIQKKGNQIWFYVKTPYSFLLNASYPVYIDPTVELFNDNDYMTLNESSNYFWDGESIIEYYTGTSGVINGNTQIINAFYKNGFNYDGGVGNNFQTNINLDFYNGNFTVVFWGKTERTTASAFYSTPDQGGPFQSHQFYIQADGNPYLNSISTNDLNCEYTGSVINSNVWVHYAIVYASPSNHSLYINGTLVGECNDDQLSFSSTGLYFGQEDGTHGQSSDNVSIDEFEIYGGILNETLISTLANATIPINTSIILENFSVNFTYPKLNDTLQFNLSCSGVVDNVLFSWNGTNGLWQNNSYNLNGEDIVFLHNITLINISDIGSFDYYGICSNIINITETSIYTQDINKLRPNATVTLSPQPANETDNLTLTITFSDLENDTWISNETRWYNNSILLSDNNDSLTLSTYNLSSGANITASVRVYDRFNWSDWVDDTIIINDNTAPDINSLSVSTTSATTSESITFTVNVTDTTSSFLSDSCVFGLYKSDLAAPKFNITSTDINGDLITRALLLSTYGIGTLEWIELWCQDGSGNQAENLSIGINISISTPPSDIGAPGGGGGSSTGTENCELYLYRPTSGQIITSYAPTGKFTKPNKFIIKNTGETSGTFNFFIQENPYLEDNCELEFTTAEVSANLEFTNSVKCKSDESIQEGIIHIEGCAMQDNLRLIISRNIFFDAIIKFIGTDTVNIAGKEFNTVILLLIGVILLGVSLPTIVAFFTWLWRKVK